MKITGIILMAGNSSRYGKSVNKNLESLNGKTVMEYSLDALEENNYITDVVLVVKKEETSIVEKIIKGKKLKKEVHIIQGGKNRCESVYNAIRQINSDLVLIQDGARPFIKQSYINNCVQDILIDDIQGVAIAVRSKDTIKITDPKNIVIHSTKRDVSWLVQTPQCFKRTTLLESYSKIKDFTTITDDCMILEMNGYSVKLILGDYSNIKLTTPEDFAIAKVLQRF